MRPGPKGFDYASLEDEYQSGRRADPRIEAQLHRALGDAPTVLNAGAGTGSYEPTDRYVVAVEPSAAMRAKRPAGAAPALAAGAEALPFDDDAFEASMAVLTVHHWTDRAAGLAELRRVTRGPVVVMTFDPDAASEFWLRHYVPEIEAVEGARYGPLASVEAGLGGSLRVEAVDVARDCRDHFQVALYARPERFLDPAVRRAQSAWSHLPEGAEERGIERLREELASGAWDERFGFLRSRESIRCQLRLVVSEP